MSEAVEIFNSKMEAVLGKVRDSGMPEETYWASFFDVGQILDAFGIDHRLGDVVEFGSGYGTFSLAVARRIHGILYALDIEKDLVKLVEERGREEGLANLIAVERDFAAWGTGLEDASVDAALQFNILHHEQPLALIREAFRVLKPGGLLAVIHWIHDPATPRGPDLAIRPTPDQCVVWAKEAGFTLASSSPFNLKPWHYGLPFSKEP